MVAMDKPVRLYCDGGIIGHSNPGDGVYWSVGQATGEDGRDTEIVEKEGTYNYHTNNEAEYLALNAALQHAATLAGETDHVVIHSDSQLIVNQFNGRWRCGKAHLRKLLATTRRNAEFLDDLGIKVEVMWVKRDVSMRRLGH